MLRSVVVRVWPRALTVVASCSLAVAAPLAASGHRVTPTASSDVTALPVVGDTPYTYRSLAGREVAALKRNRPGGGETAGAMEFGSYS